MSIECGLCNDDQVWCIRYNDGWICKRCFIDEGMGDIDEWNLMNAEEKRLRELKRMKKFDEEYVDI